jgi:KaiC/GvpD/RAD55 family RecA-like ATPase
LPIPEILQAEKVMIASRDSMVEQMGVSNKKFNVVIDSVTAFSPFMSIREMHQVIQNAQVMAAENNHIMIFAAHEGALEGNLVQVVRQYADGVIRLRTRWVRGKLRREMLIEKMRFTEISEPVLEYRIGSEGIEIL